MPAPPNRRRTSTGPKAENNSRMSSGDTASACPGKVGTGFPIRTCAKSRIGWALLVGLGGRFELHRFAAAAGGGLVRIVEHELGGELVGLIVHLGAEQEQHRLGIDQDTNSLVLEHLAALRDPPVIFHRS